MPIHYAKSVILFHALLPIFLPFSSSSTTYTTLNQGSSLSSPADVMLSSPNRIFTAGFYPVGDNAYCFAIWFTHASADGTVTVVWMANRDKPVNGEGSNLSLLNSGNLVLQDAGQLLVWTSGTTSAASIVLLQLHDSGDLVLRYAENATVIWRSFDSPTNTLLPHQPFTRNMNLISSRSRTNYSSGLYKFHFDDDNVLGLLYDGVEMTCVFWPRTWLMSSWEAAATAVASATTSAEQSMNNNTSKTAMLDLYGVFVSTDNFRFQTSDVGAGPQRRLTLDPDGLLRVYSLNKRRNKWEVSWQLGMAPCSIHGICGANSLCTYSHGLGRRCVCLPGYKIKNNRDWSEGCVPDFVQTSCKSSDHNSDGFVEITHAEFTGYDIGTFQNRSLEECESICLSYCDCIGFQFNFQWDTGIYICYPKTLLINGFQSSGHQHSAYVRLPNRILLTATSKPIGNVQSHLDCTNSVVEVERAYKRANEYAWLKSLVWCVAALGVVEVMCLLIFLYKTHGSSNQLHEQGYFQVVTGFKRFTYAELKKASRNFSQEIGRGGSGVVYKGVLSDNRVAAIKSLNEATQGEAEFLAEIGLIGRLNHANLIERWGYCAEGKHRLLVYEYLGNGSLAENLCSNKLDWRNKFDIAVGTAKGLAYLHEECLEWVLHCDVKPHNILLDANYQPKVADFGLSKHVERSGVENLKVSTIRGTRGYMAPEWVYNLPITAKVDVYSYGIVVLEMVSGKSPQEMNVDSNNNGGILGNRRNIIGEEDEVDGLMEKLERVALQCAQENTDARPTMTKVVDMLLAHQNDHAFQ